MRQLVIICPMCGDSMIMQVQTPSEVQGGFTSRCGTQIRWTCDSRFETETARVRALRERSKNEHATEQA
jgi:hypothetical protein